MQHLSREEERQWAELTIESDPRNVLNLMTLGDALRERGKLEKALLCFQRAAEISQVHEVEPGIQCDTCIALGRLLTDMQQYDHAVECLRRALALAEHKDVHVANRVGVHDALARALKRLGLSEESDEHSKRARELLSELTTDAKRRSPRAALKTDIAAIGQGDRDVSDRWTGLVEMTRSLPMLPFPTDDEIACLIALSETHRKYRDQPVPMLDLLEVVKKHSRIRSLGKLRMVAEKAEEKGFLTRQQYVLDFSGRQPLAMVRGTEGATSNQDVTYRLAHTVEELLARVCCPLAETGKMTSEIKARVLRLAGGLGIAGPLKASIEAWLSAV